MRGIRRILALGSSVALALTLAGVVAAQVEPDMVQLTLPAGGSETVEKRVHVPGDPTKEFVVAAGKEIDCPPELSVTFDQDTQRVNGGETAVFQETIAVSGDAAPGDYHCVVLFVVGDAMTGEKVLEDEQEIWVTVPPPDGGVPVDVKPESCPNPLNAGKDGVLPVAVLGTAGFDVTQIDPTSVTLEGVAPLRWDFEDVATPFEPFTGKSDRDDCTTDGADGFLDLTFKFDAQSIVAAIGPVSEGDVVVLHLTGNLLPEFGGTPFMGEDVVWIR